MADQLTDAEKLAYISEILNDEEVLEAHYRQADWDVMMAQANAFLKIRRFLRDN